MAEQTSQEPTMEEILASIRRIISEDETPAAKDDTAPPHGDEPPAPELEPVAEAPASEPEPELEPEPVAAAAPEPEPEPEPEAHAEPEEEEDALELTDKVETHGDLDVYTPNEPAPEPPRPAPAPEPVAASTLISATTAAAAASSFDKLEAAILMPQAGRTLEDVVREMLRPMLQQWLDDNLPGIVAEAVQAEVERIARGRVR
jgi:cell pole-organizing protein PopZ